MISVKAYHKQEQNRRLRQLFSGKWTIQVRNPGMSRGCHHPQSQASIKPGIPKVGR